MSSFGLGGTNAHVVLEEPPAQPAAHASRPQHLLVLSARSEAALERAADNLIRHLDDHPELPLADVAYTLQVGRANLPYRRMAVVTETLDCARLSTSETVHQTERDVPVVLECAADGVWQPQLLALEPAYRAAAGAVLRDS